MINKILTAYEWRHACKEFDSSRKISQGDFEFLLRIISLSPSSFGLQPYEVFVLQNSNLLTKLHPHLWGAQKQLFSASHVLMFVAKKDVTVSDLYFEHMLMDVQKTPDEMLDMRRNLIREHQATEVNVNDNPRYLVDWATKQAYIALGNVMSAASQIGIDSCPVEGFIKDKTTQVLRENKVFDANKYAVAVFCCLGYRLTPPSRPKTRKAIDELVHYC